ncbi:hypothetical protein Tco_0682794 [Tanacetum coccineum]|uniref:Uncharacterized protein n=1 Tax=Tanacetum coccineum TaxID=301880 RepID=A0ABQ4XS76_9ASTR
MLDALLVPIDDQVKIGLSNYMIALEKTQPDVIYKVCLAILQQYSFFNAFIRTVDAPEIYINLKFSNKGAKDLVFGMLIPMVMLNDEIQASDAYL